MLFKFRRRWFWFCFWVASIVGALLTGSRTGILGTTLVGMVALVAPRPRLWPIVAVVSFPILLFLSRNLDLLSGRSEILALLRESGPYDARISVLVENLQGMTWIERIIGRGLGYASNTAFRVIGETEAAPAELVTADSLFTFTLFEFGFLGAAAFWIITASFFLRFPSSWLGGMPGGL